ncbi:hypothetical protein ACE6H2_016744 [Prunus campanulata]
MKDQLLTLGSSSLILSARLDDLFGDSVKLRLISEYLCHGALVLFQWSCPFLWN